MGTEDIVDSAVNDVQQSEASTSQVEVRQDDGLGTEPQAEAAENADKQGDQEGKEETPFPTKAKNALARRDRQIRGLRAEKAALLAEIQRLTGAGGHQNQQHAPQRSQKGEPQIEDYDSFDEYHKALVKYGVESQFSDISRTQQEQQQAAWVESRESAIAEKVQTYSQEIPDFGEVVASYADIADTFPKHIELAFLQADDGALAFYNLAKEGKLETLASLPPYHAIAAIAAAEGKRPQATQQGGRQVQPRVSSAPAPIQAPKGAVSGQKSLETMNWKELKGFIRS